MVGTSSSTVCYKTTWQRPKSLLIFLLKPFPERLLNLVEADVLVCGHTHLPYHRVLGSGRHVINAGSVGKPKDHDPRACYLVLAAEERALHVQFIRVAYDIEQAAQAIEKTDMPDQSAVMLRQGSG